MYWKCRCCLIPQEQDYWLGWSLFCPFQLVFSTFLCILWIILAGLLNRYMAACKQGNKVRNQSKESYQNEIFSWSIKFGGENRCLWVMSTCNFAVIGSYPAPPDAKFTPVASSLGWRFGSRYAGSNSLMPNSSTGTKNYQKKKQILSKICSLSHVMTISITRGSLQKLLAATAASGVSEPQWRIQDRGIRGSNFLNE